MTTKGNDEIVRQKQRLDDVLEMRRVWMVLRLAASSVLKSRYDAKELDHALKRLESAQVVGQDLSPAFLRREAIDDLLCWLVDERTKVLKELGIEQ